MGRLTEKIALTNNSMKDFDNLINSKPKDEVEEEQLHSKKDEALDWKNKNKEKDLILQPLEKEISKTSNKTPKGKRIPVTTYFETEDYESFEDVRDDLQKSVRRETEIKLKEANVIEISVLIMMEEFKTNPEKLIKRFARLVKAKKIKTF